MLYDVYRLWALFYLWTSLFAVIALPLQGGSNLSQLERRTNSGLHSTQASSSHVISSKNTGSTSTAPGKVPIQLWVYHQGQDDEHWVLVIDRVNGFHAINPEEKPKPGQFTFTSGLESVTLIPQEFAYHPDKANKLMNLDCEAMFENYAEMKNVFKKLVNDIKMPTTADGVGGNCIDYVKMALKFLQKGEYIPSVPRIFTTLYKKNYEAVRKEVYLGGRSNE
ncbi:hypothetical protein J3R30DRAFT_217442 [Lentinula aciculospora]|uniref:Uncharacterized protein n=1 Tax=Lentinula aciculospora TaxID=153920 RepID=A0A9W9DN09_9AGAR|nr:hypothetical protein J3R30DRAFT_217442 [Lentinula aciculospora]